MQDRMDMSGRLRIVLHDAAGRVVLERRQANRIVSDGRLLVAEMFAGQTGGPPRLPVSAIAVGEGNAEPQDSDKALKAQRGSRKAISNVKYSPFTEPGGASRVSVQLTSRLDFNEANDPSIPLREAGLFNADGVLYSRVVFKDVTKTDTFQLTLFWEIVF